jgi:hypothetical protein
MPTVDPANSNNVIITQDNTSVVTTTREEQIIVQSLGAQGPKGSTILKGYGPPASNVGITGDFYIDSATYRVYGPKTTDTVWDLTSYITLQGVDGKSFLTGIGAPDSSLGNYKDTYLDLSTDNLYTKELSGWVFSANIVNKNEVSYVHEQQSARRGGTYDNGWHIYHNLGYRPSVMVSDYGGNNVECDIEHVSVNQLTLTFSDLTSGYAYLS